MMGSALIASGLGRQRFGSSRSMVVRGLALAVAIGSTAVASPASAYNLAWTPWVSEENNSPPTYCSSWDEAAVGFQCWGSYCDWVHLLCETLPNGIVLDSGTDYWSRYFSEENDGIETTVSYAYAWHPTSWKNAHFCNSMSTSGVVSGIRCQGSYCDNISLECTQPVAWVNGRRLEVPFSSCDWSEPISEEQPAQDFGPNHLIAGVECSGSYCDNKRFYVCSLDLNPSHWVDPTTRPPTL